MLELMESTLLKEKTIKDFAVYGLKNDKYYLAFSRGNYPQVFVPDTGLSIPITFEGKQVGLILAKVLNQDLEQFAAEVSPLFAFYQEEKVFTYLFSLYEFLKSVKDISPEKFNWVGLYFKEKTLRDTNSTDLIVGPYLGEVTEHVRIPLDRGLCGLALREERVVNMPDVHADTRHIACSLKTNSELIVPLKNSAGEFVAELDIDSHAPAAFSTELEAKVRELCDQFSFLD